MPIGLVVDNEFDLELQRLNPKRNESHKKESHGRNEGDVNVPDSLRKIIGEEAVINGRKEALKLARDFNISPSSVSAYAKGATSTASYHAPSESIISHINHSRRRAIKRASHTLNQALGSITQEKLDYSDAKDLASIAKNMSAIIKDLEPQSVEVAGTATPQFVIFAPSFRREETFEVIDVKE